MKYFRKFVSAALVAAVFVSSVFTFTPVASAEGVVTGAVIDIQNDVPVLIDGGKNIQFITGYVYDNSGVYLADTLENASVSLVHELGNSSYYVLNPVAVNEDGLYSVDLSVTDPLGVYDIQIYVNDELIGSEDFIVNKSGKAITDGQINMYDAGPFFANDFVTFETAYAYNLGDDLSVGTASDDEISLGLYYVNGEGEEEKYFQFTEVDSYDDGEYELLLSDANMIGGELTPGNYMIVAYKAQDGEIIESPKQEIARSDVFEILEKGITVQGSDHYVGQNFVFTLVGMPEDSVVKVSKYVSSKKADKIEMNFDPVIEGNTYTFPLTVEDYADGLYSHNDYTPGYYVIDVMSGDEIVATEDFDILSSLTGAQIEIDYEEALLLNGNLDFSTLYQLQGIDLWQDVTPELYDGFVAIYKDNGGGVVGSLYPLEIGETDEYSLDENGNYSVNLNSDFAIGDYKIVIFKGVHIGKIEGEFIHHSLGFLLEVPFSVKELIDASFVAESGSLGTLILNGSKAFDMTFDLSGGGEELQIVDEISDGNLEFFVYKKVGEEFVKVEIPEEVTVVTRGEDGGYELSVSDEVFEAGDYLLEVKNKTDVEVAEGGDDEAVEPYDSVYFTVIDPLVTSIGENLQADLNPAYGSETYSYTLGAENGESNVSFVIEMFDGATLQINDEDKELADHYQYDLQVGENTFVIKASYVDEYEEVFEATYTIVVTRSDEVVQQQQQGGGGGGGGSHKKKDEGDDGDVELLSDDIAEPFTDMEDHWAAEYVNALRLKGIVKGRSEGVYAPNEYITRAELLKIAIKLFGIEVEEEVTEKPFDDVEIVDWFASYVQAGKKYGLIDGYEDGTFKPNVNISRAEALKILLNASGYELLGGVMDFKDTESGTWYERFIAYAQSNEIVVGYGDGTFRPGNPVTRGEIAVMAVKIDELKDK